MSNNRTTLAFILAVCALAAAIVGASMWRGGQGWNPAPTATSAASEVVGAGLHASTAPSATSSPIPTAPPLAIVTLRAAGDVIIDAPMLAAAYKKGAYSFGKYFALIAGELGNADLTAINVEAAIARQGELGYTGYPSFNTPSSILTALKAAGVDLLTLANNHSLDRYFDGLMDTLRNVDKAGLLRTGAYRSQKEHDAPKLIEVSGIQIGVTNYTTGLNGVEKRSDKRATQYGVRTVQKANFKKDIQALRDAGAQAVVVFMHWDREYKRMPSAKTEKLAQQLADAGADVIIGGHPHQVQPIAWLEGKDGHRTLCAYSLGNFLSNHEGEYLDNGIILQVRFALTEAGEVEVVDPAYLPVWVWVQKQDDKLNYQVVPIEKTLADRPAAMTDEQYERLGAALKETESLLADSPAKRVLD